MAGNNPPTAIRLGSQKAQKAQNPEKLGSPRLDPKTAAALGALATGGDLGPQASHIGAEYYGLGQQPPTTAPSANTPGGQFWHDPDFRQFVNQLAISQTSVVQPSATYKSPQSQIPSPEDAARVGRFAGPQKIAPPTDIFVPKPAVGAGRGGGPTIRIPSASAAPTAPVLASDLPIAPSNPQAQNWATGLGLHSTTPNAPVDTRNVTDITNSLFEAKRPRQIFSLEGQPLEIPTSKEDFDRQVSIQYAGHPVMAALTIGWNDLRNWFSNAGKNVSMPSIGVMEAGTGQNAQFPLTIVPVILNAIAAAGSGLQLINMAITSPSDVVAKQYQKQANDLQDKILNGEIVKGTYAFNNAVDQIKRLNAASDRITISHNNALNQWKIFTTGVANSWQRMIKSIFTKPNLPPGMPNHPLSPKERVAYAQQLSNWNKYVADQSTLSISFHNNAMSKYAQIQTATTQEDLTKLANDAIDAEIQSIQARRNSIVGLDPYASYTFDSEPQKFDQFMRNLAFYQLQTGHDATPAELQMIKDHYINPWTDGVGQAIFDPLWLVPEKAMQMLFKPIEYLGKGIKLGVEAMPEEWVVRKIFLQANSSVGNTIERVVTNTASRMSLAYSGSSVTTFIDEMDKIGEVALKVDAKLSAEGIDAAHALYDAEKAAIPGLRQIDFIDFKNFYDSFRDASGWRINPTEWAGIMSDGQDAANSARILHNYRTMTRAGIPMDEAYAKAVADAQKYVEDVSRSSEHIDYFAGKARNSFLDPHRAWQFSPQTGKASILIDDTISGAIAKSLVEHGHFETAKTLEQVIKVGTTIRNVWTSMVLSLHPSWIIRNFFDSGMRDVVYGGNIMEDLDTLMSATHLLYANDAGFIPVEFGQSLARAGLGFEDRVPARLLSGEWKPKFGLFSYWKYEWDRLHGLGGGAMDAEEIAANIAKAMEHPEAGNLFGKVWDGMKNVVKATGGSISDFNTAIEFTMRLRMFHREYFNIIHMLEPELLSKGFSGLSPEARTIARNAWEMSRGNAEMLGAYLDSVIMRPDVIDKFHPQWSYTLPEGFGRGMDNPALFVDLVRRQTDNWIEAIVRKEGRLPNAAEIDHWTESTKEALKNEVYEKIANNLDKKGAASEIGTRADSEMTKEPGAEDFNGSHPVTASERPDSTAEFVFKPSKTVSPADVVNNYSGAIGDYATVKTVPGKGLTVKNVEGEAVIEIGDELLLKPRALANRLHDATIDAFTINDAEFIGGMKMTPNDWKATFKDQFLKDPMKLRNANPPVFASMVRQMENNPDIYKILEATGKVASYEQAAVNLRKFGYLSYLDELPPNQFFGLIAEADAIAHPRSPAYLISGDKMRNSTGLLAQALFDSGDDELKLLGAFGGGDGESARQSFINQLTHMQDQYKDYTRLVSPGPMSGTKFGEVRNAAWEHWQDLQTQTQLWRTEMQDSLRDMIKTNPANAKTYLQKLMADNNNSLTEWFLKENGYNLIWDAKHTKIIGGTMVENGVERPLSVLETIGLRKKFFDPSAAKFNPLITINASGVDTSIHRQLVDALATAFGMKNKEGHAMARYFETQGEQWVKLYPGATMDDYFARVGFERVGNEMQLARSGGNIDMLKKGLVVKDARSGRIMFYGSGSHDLPEFIRQSSVLFYNDWADLAKVNPKVARELEAINSYLGVAKGQAPTVEQFNKFADTFTRYIAGGAPVDEGLKLPFKSYKGSLTRQFESIWGSQNLLNLPPEVQTAMNKIFLADKSMYPPATASARMVKQMAKEAGVNADETAILNEINKGRRPPISANAAYSKDSELGKALTQWQGAGAGGAEKKALVTAVEKNPQQAAAWQADTRKFLDELYPNQDYVDLTLKVSGSPKFRPYDSLSLSPQGASGISGYALTVRVPKDNILTTAGNLDKGVNPLFGMKGEQEVILNGNGYRGAEILGEGNDAYVNLMKESVDKYPAAKAPPVPVQIELPKAEPLLDTAHTKPISELPASLGEGFKSDAQALLDELHTGEAGGKASVEGEQVSWSTSNAGWYRELNAEHKWGKPIIEKALNKIIAGENDKGAVVEELKRLIISRMQSGTPTGTPPNLYNLVELGAPQDALDRALAKFNEMTGQEYNMIDALASSGMPEDKLQGWINANYPPIADLSEASKTEVTNALRNLGATQDAKIHKQIQEAFDIWKERPEFMNFPRNSVTLHDGTSVIPMADTDQMKAYLKDRIANHADNGSNLANEYSRRLWQVEDFENQMMNFHAPDNLGEGATAEELYGSILHPTVPTFMMDKGYQTWVLNNIQDLNQYEAAMQELDRMGDHLKSGKGFSRIIPNDLKEELKNWRVRGMSDKAKLVSTALNGGTLNGHNVEGAISKVSRVMLDYNYRTRFDNFMRNIYPFWMFPSRSWPFWAETLATHPSLIAAYQKVQNLSRQARYQAGAVTSGGKPLASLEGYIPIPGTDLWFNPMAPLSFSYMLNIGQDPNTGNYTTQDNADEVPPTAQLVQHFIEGGQIYGFSVAPWTAYLMKKAFNISNDVMPAYPLVPQIALVPRWMVADLIDKANKVNVFGMTGWGDAVYPEVSWHDYLVEKQMLTDLNQKIQNMNPTDALHMTNDVAMAIQDKGNNPMWQKAYQDYTNSEASRSWGSFFDGFYLKPFTDADADLLALRNQNNLTKSALNNKFQSAIFNMPTDSDAAWNQYLNMQSAPEGWLYRLYTDIGWVRNDQNQLVTDPAERAKFLAQKVMQDERQTLYYSKVSQLQNQLNGQLQAVGVGAPWEKVAPIYDRYYNALDQLAPLNSYSGAYGSNKPVDLIEKQLTDNWWRLINHTKPRYDPTTETYSQYQDKVQKWTINLPQLAQQFQRRYSMNPSVANIMSNLHPDQTLSNDFFSKLVAGTNEQGYKAWQLSHDSVFDALNRAWEDLYWSPYWELHKDAQAPNGWKQGYAWDLADSDFQQMHPEPPTTQEMFDYINKTYGGKFSFDQISKWMQYDPSANVYDIQQRLTDMHSTDPNWQTKQDIYNYLAMAGPGKNRDSILSSLSAVQNNEVENFLSSGGHIYDAKPQDLQRLHDYLKNTAANLGLKAPDRNALIQFVQAENSNNNFHQYVSNKIQMSWDDIQGVLNQYYGSPSSALFQKNYPQDYRHVVQPYLSSRNEWASQHPEWAAFYMWKNSSKYYGRYQNYLANKYNSEYAAPNPYYVPPTAAPPSSTTPVVPIGAVPQGQQPQQPQAPSSPADIKAAEYPAAPFGAKPVTPPISAPQTTGPVKYEKYGGVSWPSGMRQAISPMLVKEIINVTNHPGNYRISAPGIRYLSKLMGTHPEWADFIKNYLH